MPSLDKPTRMVLRILSVIKRIAVEEGYRDVWDEADKQERKILKETEK